MRDITLDRDGNRHRGKVHDPVTMVLMQACTDPRISKMNANESDSGATLDDLESA